MGSKPNHDREEVETITGDSLLVDFFHKKYIVLSLRNPEATQLCCRREFGRGRIDRFETVCVKIPKTLLKEEPVRLPHCISSPTNNVCIDEDNPY